MHVAEVESFLMAHQVYGKRPLDQAGRDEYVAQTAVVAGRLGVLDPPTTEAELTAAVEAFRPELAATEHAREAVSFLVWHPPLPWAARPGYGALVAAAIGLMPVWTRRPLRLPWFPVSERTVVRALGSAATGTIRWALQAAAAVRSSGRRAGGDERVAQRGAPVEHLATRPATQHDAGLQQHLEVVADRADRLAAEGREREVLRGASSRVSTSARLGPTSGPRPAVLAASTWASAARDGVVERVALSAYHPTHVPSVCVGTNSRSCCPPGACGVAGRSG